MTTIGLIGNVVTFILTLKTFKRPSNLFQLELFICNFLMAVYIAAIIIQDIRYSGNYIEFDNEWRKSTLCNSLGVLASVSSLLSLFLLLILTIEKYLVIKYQLNFQFFTWRKVFVISTIAISISIIFSIIPLYAYTVSFIFFLCRQ